MARSPLRDGWRVLMRAPAAFITEIAWRWTFGVAFWAILYYSFREYFASVEISNAEYMALRSLQPYTWIAVTARVMAALIMGLRLMGPIIVPALIILWTALAAFGRAATVRSLSDTDPRTNWVSTLGLHLFRAALTIASFLAFFGCGTLIDNLVGDPSQHFAVVFLLSFLALAVVALVWSVVNWFFSLAAIFTARDRSGFFSSLSEGNALYRRQSAAFFSAGFWFGVSRTVLIVMATFASLIPIARLSTTHLRLTIFIVVIVTLGYFAIADALNVWRLATYISLSEPEPEPTVVVTPLQPAFPTPHEDIPPPAPANNSKTPSENTSYTATRDTQEFA